MPFKKHPKLRLTAILFNNITGSTNKRLIFHQYNGMVETFRKRLKTLPGPRRGGSTFPRLSPDERLLVTKTLGGARPRKSAPHVTMQIEAHKFAVNV